MIWILNGVLCAVAGMINVVNEEAGGCCPWVGGAARCYVYHGDHHAVGQGMHGCTSGMVCGVISAARPARCWRGRWARYLRPGALGLIKAPRGDAVLVLVGGRSKRASGWVA